MAAGFWEVDVPKKGNTACARCGNVITSTELRFQWCPVGEPKVIFHAFCAVCSGSTANPAYLKNERATIRKTSGLGKTQQDALTKMLGATTPSSAKSILGEHGMSVFSCTATPTKVLTSRTKANAPMSGAKRSQDSHRQEPSAKRTKSKASTVDGSFDRILPLKKPAKQDMPPQGSKRSTSVQTQRAASKTNSATQKSGGKSKIPSSELKKFNEAQTCFSAKTNDNLKKLLHANDQSRSGNKAVLVAKCADGESFGKLPRCPKCFGGKIKFRLPGSNGELYSLYSLFGGAYGDEKTNEDKAKEVVDKQRYYCTGYFDDDEKVECDWQSHTVKREPWVSI